VATKLGKLKSAARLSNVAWSTPAAAGSKVTRTTRFSNVTVLAALPHITPFDARSAKYDLKAATTSASVTGPTVEVGVAVGVGSTVGVSEAVGDAVVPAVWLVFSWLACTAAKATPTPRRTTAAAATGHTHRGIGFFGLRKASVDYCPTCRGVWLDRGELDKIIERGAGAPASTPPAPAAQQTYPDRGQYQDRGGYQPSSGYDQYGRKRKKENWLSELFD